MEQKLTFSPADAGTHLLKNISAVQDLTRASTKERDLNERLQKIGVDPKKAGVRNMLSGGDKRDLRSLEDEIRQAVAGKEAMDRDQRTPGRGGENITAELSRENPRMNFLIFNPPEQDREYGVKFRKSRGEACKEGSSTTRGSSAGSANVGCSSSLYSEESWVTSYPQNDNNAWMEL